MTRSTGRTWRSSPQRSPPGRARSFREASMSDVQFPITIHHTLAGAYNTLSDCLNTAVAIRTGAAASDGGQPIKMYQSFLRLNEQVNEASQAIIRPRDVLREAAFHLETDIDSIMEETKVE